MTRLLHRSALGYNVQAFFTSIMRTRTFLLSFVAAAAAFVSSHSLAAYPDKPIRLVVPSAPGGAPDVLMRSLAQQMSVQMGVPIVIDNKPGGSYVIGTMDVVKAAPDGYTLGYGNIVSLATNRGLMSNIPYDLDKDLTLIGNSFKVVNMMIVNNDLPVKNVKELIAYAKKNPGKIAFGSGGNGTTDHLGVELFKSMTGTHLLHVPYKGTSSALTDLQGGQIQLMMSNTPLAGPPAQAGRVRPLAVSSRTRSPSYPDIPTLDEAGVKGFEVISWGGLIGPPGMPKDIVERINKEMRAALASQAVKDRYKVLGAEPDPSSPEEFREHARRETVKWAQVIKFSGAKVD
ncbi:Bug family tripartite tricarboxylate transporter substrate binding protein [Ramlibacter lithotrophicus]|nr:tripartite tricarboxylate transporter substrate binding protein [Ramlibacter lithotrophicus]